MESQDVVNIVLAVGGFLITTLFTMAAAKIKEIQNHLISTAKELNEFKLMVARDYAPKNEFSSELKEISRKLDDISSLELRMADKYAKKDDLNRLGESLGAKLDKIMLRLDTKVDRRNLPPHCSGDDVDDEVPIHVKR